MSRPGGPIIIVEREAEREWAASAGIAVTMREYVTGPERYGMRPARVVNLSGDLEYLDLGYYCSLLAEARGQRVVPTVSTILDLSRKELYSAELPELNAELRRTLEKLGRPPRGAFALTLTFGRTRDAGFKGFARALFDRFRCPLLQVQVVLEERWRIVKLAPLSPAVLDPEEFEFFLAALQDYTKAKWRRPRARQQTRYSLAILHNPAEALAPSNAQALRRFAALGPALGIGVEFIQRRDFLRLAEFDALFIRETTGIGHHTYRFARKAAREGMVVIDDPVSILRCTNKVYLAELLQANRLSAPRTVILDRGNLLSVEAQIDYPLVLKIPDGSFSRGIFKAEDRGQLVDFARRLFKRTAVILAQEFMFTDFDWRVGVLGGKPLFVSQYFMSRRHWQIVNHKGDGRFASGGFKTFAVEEAPEEVVELGIQAAALIGDGLYGVDIKQNERGLFVIEINDNPNLDRGVEDAVLKGALYEAVLRDFVRRIEERPAGS